LVNGGNPNQEISHNPLEDLIRGEETEQLGQAIGQLDPDTLTAIRMRFYEDLTFEQIAKAFGVSNPTAAAMVKRGLIALREAIGE
jgi:RNA polymerase sigma factor (sigma-70 family)